MPKLSHLVAPLLLSVALASPASAPGGGCAPSIGNVFESGGPHNHADALSHQGRSESMIPLGSGLPPIVAGTQFLGTAKWGEADVVGDHLYTTMWREAPGFAVWSLRDPSTPALAGVGIAAGAVPIGSATDIKVTPDGNWAFLSLEFAIRPAYVPGHDPTQAQLPPLEDFDPMNPLATVDGPYGDGIEIFDVRDKLRPVSVGFVPTAPNGPHMMLIVSASGQDYLVTTPEWGTPGDASPPFHSLLHLFRIGYPQAAGELLTLTHVSTIAKPTQRFFDPNAHNEAAHDVWFHEDLVNGYARPLLYVADGHDGVTVYDLSDPGNPALAGRWIPPAGDLGGERYYHTVRAVVHGDRRFILANTEGGHGGLPTSLAYNLAGVDIGEVGSSLPAVGHYFAPFSKAVSKMIFLDATKLDAIELVSTWNAPGDHPEGPSFRFSQHNFQVVDGRVYMAHYHGGVWVLDVSSPEAIASPRPLGYIFPHPPVAVGVPFGDHVPWVWDVVVKDGVIYASDTLTGPHALRYLCDELGSGGPSSYG